MATSQKRKRYLIHPSSQLKYIEMAIIPAVLMSVFCVFFLLRSGEFFLVKERKQLQVELGYLSQTITHLSREQYPAEMVTKVEVLKTRLNILKHNMEMEYQNTLRQWAETKIVLFLFLAVAVVVSGIMALLLSHRIAGPIYRLGKSLEMLADGKDTAPLKFRRHDEFKEIVGSFEKLRASLKEKGMLR